MRHLFLHYKNKYPGGKIEMSEDRLDVYDADGEHAVAVRKSGAGGMVDMSKELGAKHSHDMSPLPKDARLWKNCPKSGAVIKDEKFAERSKLMVEFLEDGKILSCEELQGDGLSPEKSVHAGRGFKFDDKQVLLSRPSK